MNRNTAHLGRKGERKIMKGGRKGKRREGKERKRRRGKGEEKERRGKERIFFIL